MPDYLNHIVRNCVDYDPKKFRPGAMSLKKDGVRGYYYPGERTLWSRDQKRIYGMDHIVEELEAQKVVWPVDMELYIPGMEFNTMSGLIRDHNDTPDAQAHVIDMVIPKMVIAERLQWRPEEWGPIYNIPHYMCKTIAKRDELHARFLKDGHEGSVLKTLVHFYENKRDWHWMRDVPIKSEDCVCTGVYEGKGKMQGMAGGIFIDFQGIPGKCGTMKGLTYDDRRDLLLNADDYIGVVAEIQYKNLQPSGLPRQPRFKGWRYDK